jgi:N-acetylglucosaminyldiphosphoundecaprenol N-acetyl-beta-D-mannosaminyltransferase
MQRDSVIILGVPIDSLTLSQAMDKIVDLVAESRRDGISKLVATVNVDFIVQTMGKRLSEIRHAELLDILRRADLVTADGMPIVWLSRMLRNPLPERVTGADMVPALATRAASEGLSLYFLGGQANSAERAADILLKRNPGLKIAGVLSPIVYTEGEHLEFYEEEDAAIVADINAAAPDILLIAFGNPKQELWFRRNVTRLKVPLSIGIGGTFSFIAGDISRAPLAIQRIGLEWLWRLAVEPIRLWRRYLRAIMTFGLQLWPAVMDYHRQRRLLARNRQMWSAPKMQVEPTKPEQLLPEVDKLSMTLPERLDALGVRNLSSTIETIWQSEHALILDFTRVTFIDSMGLGFIVEMWRTALNLNKVLLMAGMNDDIRRTFALSRLDDLIEDRSFRDLQLAKQYLNSMDLHQAKIAGRELPSSVTYKKDGTAIVTIEGRLDALSLKNFDITAICVAVSGHNCLMDLHALNFVDSSGLVLFVKIQRAVMAHGKSCILCAPTDGVLKLLQLTRLEQLFTITDDIMVLHQ